jgi:hypothetical protein
LSISPSGYPEPKRPETPVGAYELHNGAEINGFSVYRLFLPERFLLRAAAFACGSTVTLNAFLGLKQAECRLKQAILPFVIQSCEFPAESGKTVCFSTHFNTPKID